MLAENLYRATKAAIGDATKEAKDRVARGHWKTEAEGKRICGEIDGLSKAGTLLQAELEKLVKLEEDEVDE